MRQRRSWVLLAAATAVAGESDTGVTVSAAFATGVGCWSGCWGACLPLGSLYAGCGQDFLLSRLQLLVKNTAPFAAVGCYLFPVLRVDVQGFHVTLADIFVARLGSTNASLAGGEFTIEDAFANASILHPSHMAEPPKSALPEQCEHGRKICTLEYLGIGNLVTPTDTKDAAKASADGSCSVCVPVSSRSSMFRCRRGECWRYTRCTLPLWLTLSAFGSPRRGW